MTIHLVGETIDPKRAHLQAQAGTLVQLVRGVYVSADADIETAVLGHAVRIAQYLYPTAYLSSASALLLGPTQDGRLFISGRRNQRTPLRGLEIVQNQAPSSPSTAPAVIGDDLGELRIQVSSLRQRFLEAFRLRSEHAGAITVDMRAQMAARLVEEYGTPRDAADALWALARGNGWYREGEGAERFLLARPAAAIPLPNKAALDFIVAWHGEALGRLTHDGFEWRWKPARQGGPKLVRETTPGKLPPFIESLLPEGWLATVLRNTDEREALKAGQRYMSNIAVVGGDHNLSTIPPDLLTTHLAAFTLEGKFIGTYMGPGRGEIEESFEQNLARMFAHSETPRLSGVQIKAPMNLSADGRLVPAIELPFTHILKPAGTSGFEALPVVEWLCLELGRIAGFTVPAAALMAMPDNMPPALLVERFDVRVGNADRRHLALEDFCSVLDVPASAKYDGTIERIAKGMRAISTDPAEDRNILFKRAIFAWLIADGDMHLKNLAMLKVAQPGGKTFTSVRLAPLYDAVTTRVFPGLASDRMALKLNGKDDRLGRHDFLKLARAVGISTGDAEAALTNMATGLANDAQQLGLPALVMASESAQAVHKRVLSIVAERCAALALA